MVVVLGVCEGLDGFFEVGVPVLGGGVGDVVGPGPVNRYVIVKVSHEGEQGAGMYVGLGLELVDLLKEAGL